MTVVCGVICAQISLAEVTEVCVGLKFPEGPAYDGKQHVVCSQASGNAIARVSLDGECEAQWLKSSRIDNPLQFRNTNGLAFYKDGSLFACDNERNAIVRIHPDGRCEIYAEKYRVKGFRGPNDLAFDAKGNLYFTDPAGSGLRNPTGCVYRVEATTRKVTRVADGLAFPNGLAFSADGRWLYVAESQKNRILRFSVRSNGMLGRAQEFADLSSAGKGEPDGIAFDTAGNLWVAHFGAHQVLVISPRGETFDSYVMPTGPGHGPSNIAFAGPDRKTLYITDPTTDSLLKMRTRTPGLKLMSSP